MNQVQEMFRLSDAARVEEALQRLRGLFGTMARQPGFMHAAVTRDLADPTVLLVLHAWRRLEDWQVFSQSPWKAAFIAGRPASLYAPVPAGMNWTLVSGDEDPGPAAFVCRAVSSEEPAGTAATQTFRAADDEAFYAGRWLTLTWLDEPTHPGQCYETLLKVSAADVPAAAS